MLLTEIFITALVLFTSVDEVIEIPCQRHLKHPRVSLFSVEAKGSFLDGKLAPSRVYCLYEKPPFAALIGLIKEVGSDWRLHPSLSIKPFERKAILFAMVLLPSRAFYRCR